MSEAFCSSVGTFKKSQPCWAPVAHACNPSYSGGTDQEDRGSKPVQANSSQDPILKKTHHKKRLVEWLKWQEQLLGKCEALISNPSAAPHKKSQP
jgi:hypothetical protein